MALDRFIPERAALVKALRGEKRREEASQVTALRKPSVAAWAVNQLVRTQPKAIEALFEAGDELARAQADAVAGQRVGEAMRAATQRQRDAVRELLAAAQGLLSSEGQSLSQTMMERAGETLRAAAVDEQARRLVAGGCLTQELRVVGVGLGGASPSSVNRERAAEPTPAKEKAQGRGKDRSNTAKRAGRKTEDARTATVREANDARQVEARRAASAEREAARDRAAALKAAHRTEVEARRAATLANNDLAAAQTRREDAAASLEQAETLLGAAAKRAKTTAAQLTTAERTLRDLSEA